MPRGTNRITRRVSRSKSPHIRRAAFLGSLVSTFAVVVRGPSRQRSDGDIILTPPRPGAWIVGRARRPIGSSRRDQNMSCRAACPAPATGWPLLAGLLVIAAAGRAAPAGPLPLQVDADE